MTQVIRKLNDQAGIEGVGARAARRTFSVSLHRKGYELRNTRELLGLSTLSEKKALVEVDQVNL